MNLIELARGIAIEAHRGQFRRDGVTPYIVHPAAVVERLDLDGASEDIIAIAWLHDVLEDTNQTSADLLRHGVPAPVVDAVELMTRDKGQSYDDYLHWINMSDITRKVKIADMLANLADAPTEKQIIKYAKGLLALHNAESGETRTETQQ